MSQRTTLGSDLVHIFAIALTLGLGAFAISHAQSDESERPAVEQLNPTVKDLAHR